MVATAVKIELYCSLALAYGTRTGKLDGHGDNMRLVGRKVVIPCAAGHLAPESPALCQPSSRCFEGQTSTLGSGGHAYAVRTLACQSSAPLGMCKAPLAYSLAHLESY